MAANRKAILLAFYELERSRQVQEFTIQEVQAQAPDVKPKTLRFHVNSTMDDGKYHPSDGTYEVEKIGRRGRCDLYRLTDLGRATAKRLMDSKESQT